jgi:NAD(P)-dependent dehydrogenase (short-subunit alcohol dehydrogenase family)
MSEQEHIAIVGGTGSVGRAVAKALIRLGISPVLLARDSQAVQVYAGELDCPYEILDADRSDPIGAALERFTQQVGPLHGAVNCAGTTLLRPAHATKDAQFREVLESNLLTSFQLLASAVRLGVRQGLRLVFLSSAAATIGIANHEAIAAAKAGIEGMVRSAAATYASRGHRINCVAPGMIDSNLTAPFLTGAGARTASEQMHPLGRIGSPGDVAEAICWLLGTGSSWITGETLHVDGGLAHALPKNRL